MAPGWRGFSPAKGDDMKLRLGIPKGSLQDATVQLTFTAPYLPPVA